MDFAADLARLNVHLTDEKAVLDDRLDDLAERMDVSRAAHPWRLRHGRCGARHDSRGGDHESGCFPEVHLARLRIAATTRRQPAGRTRDATT